jgi:hypothetical protein
MPAAAPVTTATPSRSGNAMVDLVENCLELAANKRARASLPVLGRLWRLITLPGGA